MRFGVTLLNAGPLATADNLARTAHLVEDLGFDFAMTFDHVAITDDVVDRYPLPWYDPVAALAFLAGSTTTLRLGTTVLVIPHRHPLVVARMFANLDELSGGRMILGVGSGWAAEELSALGQRHNERGAVTNRYLKTIREHWTEDVITVPGVDGEPLSVHTSPRPSRPGGIPIWVGGSSDASLRRAVNFGDAWHPLGIKAHALEAVGAKRLADTAASLGRPTPAIAPRIRLELTNEPLPDDERMTGQGSVDQVRADLASYEALGIDEVLFDTTHLRDLTMQEQWALFARGAAEVFDCSTGSVR